MASCRRIIKQIALIHSHLIHVAIVGISRTGDGTVSDVVVHRWTHRDGSAHQNSTYHSVHQGSLDCRKWLVGSIIALWMARTNHTESLIVSVDLSFVHRFWFQWEKYYSRWGPRVTIGILLVKWWKWREIRVIVTNSYFISTYVFYSPLFKRSLFLFSQ